MRRRPRVNYELDSGNIQELSDQEIKMILRGADELIDRGGRTLLTKLLKGSRDKKVLEYKLDLCPAYGFYKKLTLKEISYRVDWMIKEDYLRISYNGRLPMLIFSEKGWQIEEDFFAQEIYQALYENVIENKREILSEMSSINRQVVMDVLEMIRKSKNKEFLPILEDWKNQEVRKVRERITSVQRSLENPKEKPQVRLKKAKKENWREVMKLIHKAVQRDYPEYYPDGVIQFICMYYERQRIQAMIQAKQIWIYQLDGAIIGTAVLDKNQIADIYMLSENREKGCERHMIQELEKNIDKIYETIHAEVSLLDWKSYEENGFHKVREEKMELLNDCKMSIVILEKKNGEESHVSE